MKAKSRNMVDDEEMEDEQPEDEELEEEDDDLIVNQNKSKKPIPKIQAVSYIASAPKPQQEVEREEKPKMQIVEREINLSLLNDKLNFVIAQLQQISRTAE